MCSEMDCPRGHRRRRADGLDGLRSLRKIFKARPWAKLACLIIAYLVAVRHVSSSHQLGPVLHEVITFSILGHRLRESSTA